MRGTKITLFLFLFIFFTSCTEDIQEHPAIRRIINETIYSVGISIFDDNKAYQYTINVGDTLNILGSCFSGFRRYCDIGWSGNSGNLKAHIVFDNQKNPLC